MSAKTHKEQAEEILADTKGVDRASFMDPSLLTEALVHAVLAIAEAIALLPEAMP